MKKEFAIMSLILAVSGCEQPQTYHFGFIAPEDSSYCRFQADKAAGVPSESLMGTLNQMKYRQNIMQECLLSKGYKLYPDRPIKYAH